MHRLSSEFSHLDDDLSDPVPVSDRLQCLRQVLEREPGGDDRMDAVLAEQSLRVAEVGIVCPG